MTATGSHTQDFNTLSSSGTGTWTDNSTISSWFWQKTGTGGSLNVAGTGSSNTGSGYSFGATSSSERAMGSVGSNTSGHYACGVLLENNSGTSISDIKISYTGEQWRYGGATAVQTVSFYYKISSSTITSLTPNSNSGWTAVSALDFNSPIIVGTTGALNGNASANQTIFSNVSIPCLELKDGEYIMLKWDDPDHSGSDHGLSIDDVTITWTIPTCDAATNATLASSTISGLRNFCSPDGSGWIYYADKCNPNQLLFGIKKNGNTFDATVDLTVTGSVISSTSSNGANQEHGMFLMGRYWNVTMNSGSISTASPVSVRFFYNPVDLVTAKTSRDVSYALLPATTLAVTNGNTAEWFKNTNSAPFNAAYIATIVGNRFASTYQKFASPTISTLNGVTYVELTGITSFSGGTGGFSYGPANTSGMNALPVIWAGMDVKARAEGNEILWKTASEFNSSHFEIEASNDGKNFYIISPKIQAKGYSNELIVYSYLHTDFSPLLYYRIRQYDSDMAYTLSDIVAARKEMIGAFSASILPSQDITNLYISVLSSDKISPISFQVTDMFSRVILSETLPISSDNLYAFPFSNLSKGVYFVKVFQGEQFKLIKFSK